MFEALRYAVSPIQSRCTTQRDDVTYEVVLSEGRICSELILYKVNNQNKLFKKTEVYRVIMEVTRAFARQKGVAVDGVDGLVNLAEYVVDEYIEKCARDKSEATLYEAQLKAFSEHRG